MHCYRSLWFSRVFSLFGYGVSFSLPFCFFYGKWAFPCSNLDWLRRVTELGPLFYHKQFNIFETFLHCKQNVGAIFSEEDWHIWRNLLICCPYISSVYVIHISYIRYSFFLMFGFLFSLYCALIVEQLRFFTDVILAVDLN